MLKNTRFPILLAGALILALSSCAGLKDYGKAQIDFSSGAALEIQQQASGDDSPAPEGSVTLGELMNINVPDGITGEPETYYQQALNSVEKALQSKAALEKGQADDNAAALKAMCLWQLGRYAEADAAAEEATILLQDQQPGEDDRRDQALMQALPGLTKLDQAADALAAARARGAEVEALISGSEQDRVKLYEEMKDQYLRFVSSDENGDPSVKRGMAIIEQAVNGVENQPQVKLYLTQTQLSGMEIRGDFRNNLFRVSRQLSIPLVDPGEAEWLQEELNDYREDRDALLETLIDRLGGNENHPVVQHWRGIL